MVVVDAGIRSNQVTVQLARNGAFPLFSGAELVLGITKSNVRTTFKRSFFSFERAQKFLKDCFWNQTSSRCRPYLCKEIERRP